MTTSLPSTVPLLDAFTYRHRNQHSASHWWSSHALLRRRVTALSSLLHRRSVLLDPSRKLGSSSSSSSKSKSKQLAVVERQIQNHARHVRDHVIPRAHLAFSQLLADNQHAPLGLMLLAVLAQVHACIGEILPAEISTESKTGPSTYTDTSIQPQTQPSSADNAQKKTQKHERQDADRGVAISREDIRPAPGKPATEEVVATSRSQPSPPPSSSFKGSRKEEEKLLKKKKSKSKKKKDELSSLFGSL